MARTIAVPIYITAVSTPAPLSTSRRALSQTSPGTTDSTLTRQTQAGVGSTSTYAFLVPEATGTNVANQPPPDTAPSTNGWVFDLIPALAPAGATVAFTSGTFSLDIHYSRNNTIGSSNSTGYYRVYFLRVSSDLNTVQQQLGFADTAGITWTTTEQVVPLTVNVGAAVFAPGEKLMMVVASVQTNGLLVQDATRFHTNSTTGSRITATTVTYTTTFAANLSDNTPVADSVARQYTGSRALNDSMPVTDSLARAATFRRTMTDSMPVTDSLARVFTANRALADNMPVNDALARRFTGSRTIADNVPVNDAITRRVTYARGLLEAYREGGGTTVNVFYPHVIVEEN